MEQKLSITAKVPALAELMLMFEIIRKADQIEEHRRQLGLETPRDDAIKTAAHRLFADLDIALKVMANARIE